MQANSKGENCFWNHIIYSSSLSLFTLSYKIRTT